MVRVQAVFGDTLTNPLDDLADITEQDSQGVEPTSSEDPFPRWQCQSEHLVCKRLFSARLAKRPQAAG